MFDNIQEGEWWLLHSPDYWMTRYLWPPVCALMCDDETLEHFVEMLIVAGVLVELQPHVLLSKVKQFNIIIKQVLKWCLNL